MRRNTLRFGLMAGLVLMAAPWTAAHAAPGSSDQADYYSQDGVQTDAKGQVLITFSEFADGSSIYAQYQPKGILFTGDSPFIADDASNPTSPVLSGTPLYGGSIRGVFVSPKTGQHATVTGFSLDAGYFNDIHSTRLRWFDIAGNQLGSQTNAGTGIETFHITSATPIGSFQIQIIGSEAAGYAIDNVTFGKPAKHTGLLIVSPPDGVVFPLQPPANTGTDTVTFKAKGAPVTPIDWSLQVAYDTSGHKGPFTFNDSFSTTSGQGHNEKFRGAGGVLTATATQGAQSDRVIDLITGPSSIPSADITARLVNLYTKNGAITRATPRLMTGIAERESVYQQFGYRLLMGRNDYWPYESSDGGSHIGLMQVPVSMADAWDWTRNTTTGVNLFLAKLNTASGIVQTVRSSHTGLRNLTDLEMENMGLLLYGPYASNKASMQYYVPKCMGGTVSGPACTGGHWDWVVNTKKNSSGVSDADSIRASVQ